MVDPLIRRATFSDIAQLDGLDAEARLFLVDQRGGARWLETNPARSLGWPVDDESRCVFVAYIDEVIVGYLVATSRDKVARIDVVYVMPQARELGFGDELLGAAIDWAREAGARFLEGEALPGDRDTKNLFERAGIKARLITVSTPL
jgi:GNAT superfamily N-acetyltransferase